MQSTPYTPTQAGVSGHQQQSNLSQTVNNGLDLTYPTGRDINGWPNTFAPANIRGVNTRVSSNGSTPPTGSVNWTAANTKIPHNLGYVPSGFILTYKSKACDVFAGTTPPDIQFIYLSITDDTADTNVFVF